MEVDWVGRSLVVAILAFAFYVFVAAYGDLRSSNDIEEVSGEGVRCFVYQKSVSCILDPDAKSAAENSERQELPLHSQHMRALLTN